MALSAFKCQFSACPNIPRRLTCRLTLTRRARLASSSPDTGAYPDGVSHVKTDPDGVVIQGSDSFLTYTSRAVTLEDGTTIEHESQGGQLSSVWATDLGDCYVEVVYVGDGPHGGELVVVVPAEDIIIVGDLYPGDLSVVEGLENVPPTWPGAVDLAMGLTTTTTTVLTTLGQITREEFDDSHQRLLGAVNG